MSGSTAPITLTEQEISCDSLLEKYAKGKATSVSEVRRRVARALAQAEPEEQRALWEKRFLQAQEDGFIPDGTQESPGSIMPSVVSCHV